MIPLESARRALQTGICPTQNGASYLETYLRQIKNIMCSGFVVGSIV